MGRYYKSDYAVNKFRRGIVYRFADRTVEITLEDYLAENPGSTEQDFLALKAMSDDIYRCQDLDTYNQSRLDIPIHSLERVEDRTVHTVEELYWDKADTRDFMQQFLQLRDAGELTDVQVRRFTLHIFQGLTLRQIAKREKVTHHAISQTIRTVAKKIAKLSY